MEGFFAGMAEAGSRDLEKRRDSALEIKMRSALLEQQAQEAEKAAISKNKREQFSPEGTAALGDLAGVGYKTGQQIGQHEGTVMGGLAAAGIKADATKSAFDAKGNKVSQFHMNGKVYERVQDRSGSTISLKPIGLDSTTSADVSKAEALYGTYNQNLEDIKVKIQGFITAETAAGRVGQWATKSINDVSQNDPKQIAYFKQLTLNALRTDKELTGTARFAKQFGEATMEAFPQVSDTLPVALEKIHTMQGWGRNKLDATYTGYGIEQSAQKYPRENLSQHPLVQEGQAAKDKAARFAEFNKLNP